MARKKGFFSGWWGRGETAKLPSDVNLQAAIERLTQKLHQKDDQLESLRGQRHQLQTKLQAAEDQIKNLEAQAKTSPEPPPPPPPVTDQDVADEIQQLTQKLIQREQHLQSLRDQRNRLHQQLRVAEARIQDLEAPPQEGQPSAHEEALVEQLRQMEQETAHLRDERERDQARILELEKELKNLRLEPGRTDSAERAPQTTNQLVAEMEAATEARIRELEAQLKEARSSAEAERVTLDEKHSQASGLLLAEKESAKAHTRELEAETETARQRVEELEIELAKTRSSAEAERAALTQEHSQASDRLLMQKEAAEARARELEAELKEALTSADATLSTQSEQQSQAVEEARRKTQDARQRVQALEIELAQSRSGAEADRATLTERHEQSLQQFRQEKERAESRIRELETALQDAQLGQEAAPGDRDSHVQEMETDLRRHKKALEALQRKNEELTKQLDSARWKTEEGGESARIQELERALKKAEERILDLKDDLQVWKTLADQLELTQKEAAATKPAAAEPAEVDLTPELKTTFPQQEPEAKPYDAAAASAAAAPIPAAPPNEAPAEQTAQPAPAEPGAPTPAPSLQPSAPEPAPTPAAQPAARAPAAAPAPRKKLLVAEDDPAIRRIVEITLQKEGIDVISAENGQEGLQKAIEQKPDAILTDIQMPVMTGIELAEKLRSNPATRSIPLGFLTGQREVGYYKQALALGSTIYITKPFRPDQLMMFINVLLRGKKPRYYRRSS
jgi:CheY-like chemotaxis protein